MKALKILLITVLALGMSTGYAGTTESDPRVHDPYRAALGSMSDYELAVLSLNLASGMSTGYAGTTENDPGTHDPFIKALLASMSDDKSKTTREDVDTGLDEYCVTGDLESFKKVIMRNGDDDIFGSQLKKYLDEVCQKKSLSEEKMNKQIPTSDNNNSTGFAGADSTKNDPIDYDDLSGSDQKIVDDALTGYFRSKDLGFSINRKIDKFIDKFNQWKLCSSMERISTDEYLDKENLNITNYDDLSASDLAKVSGAILECDKVNKYLSPVPKGQKQ